MCVIKVKIVTFFIIVNNSWFCRFNPEIDRKHLREKYVYDGV